MEKSTAIELPKIPKEKDYEDYLCAFMQAGGLYVERSIIHREVEELLELDILTTDFQPSSAENNLIEIKGGDWGFSDIFKIRGWLTYLNFQSGCFIVQKSREHFDYFREKARELDINLVDNSNLSKTKETLKQFLQIEPEEAEIQTIRFAFLLERKQLKTIKTLKKRLSRKSDVALDDYFFKINSGSFFSRDPIDRINKLFKIFIKYKNITAKICNELNGGDFDENVTNLSVKCYANTFYKAENNILQISLYVEHLARVTILKCAIEHLIDKLKGDYNQNDLIDRLNYLVLPKTIKEGLNEIIKDKYFYLYPRFWQFFTYVFGGFILTDIEAKEYEVLSKKTGIPVDEIPNAFDCFNKLFPRNGGWFYKFPNSGISWHSMFPISFSGIGANYRRMIYPDDKTYDGLAKMLGKNKTMSDLSKWNNLAHAMLQ
ncbi:hypothetical protein [Chitinophaga silvisoli]|uniref:Uncharacterized protein n=1 Tax=Chitinophaga silvisoli TaxID=2291814 RepID=A0A3E1PAB8_9BACT|nr:hypothetical protein [Chitinophaga silvisoli]RFM37040.1 hypothetical protein DXN04_05950 [Chitinophaga silvisoli]